MSQDKMQLLSKFLTLKQQGGETVTTYINWFQHALTQAKAVGNKCNNETWLVDLFLGSLCTDNLKYAVQIAQSQADRWWEDTTGSCFIQLTNVQAAFQKIDENSPCQEQAHADIAK